MTLQEQINSLAKAVARKAAFNNLEIESERIQRQDGESKQSNKTNDVEMALCELDELRASQVSDLENAVCELSEIIIGGKENG